MSTRPKWSDLKWLFEEMGGTIEFDVPELEKLYLRCMETRWKKDRHSGDQAVVTRRNRRNELYQWIKKDPAAAKKVVFSEFETRLVNKKVTTGSQIRKSEYARRCNKVLDQMGLTNAQTRDEFADKFRSIRGIALVADPEVRSTEQPNWTPPIPNRPPTPSQTPPLKIKSRRLRNWLVIAVKLFVIGCLLYLPFLAYFKCSEKAPLVRPTSSYNISPTPKLKYYPTPAPIEACPNNYFAAMQQTCSRPATHCCFPDGVASALPKPVPGGMSQFCNGMYLGVVPTIGLGCER